MSRYRVENFRLVGPAGEVLLAGSVDELRQMAAVLDAAKPRDRDLAATVRALVGMTRGVSFAPGSRLLGEGPTIDLRGRA